MTRTEDRLTDALHAAARSVRDETLRPLQVLAEPRRRWLPRLAPVAAAAAVAVIVILAVLIVPGRTHRPTGPSGPGAGLPPFYVMVDTQYVVVRATSTGAVTGTVPDPLYGSGVYRTQMSAVSVAAVGGGDREFIASLVIPPLGPQPGQSRLYVFRLTARGHITGLSRVRGGTLNDVAVNSVAVSPDGSQAALSVCPDKSGVPRCLDKIMVIDLKTGSRHLWQGGLATWKGYLTISDFSWTPGGSSLAFLAQPCPFPGERCGTGPAYRTQLRELDLSTGGGSLAQSSVLFSGPSGDPDLVQAQLSADGSAILAMELYGRVEGSYPSQVRVLREPLAGGQAQILYHWPDTRYGFLFLRSDASGRYLLLSGGNMAAWIDHGKLHVLPGQFMPSAAVW